MTGDYLTILLFIAALVGMLWYIGYSERKKQLVAVLQMYQHINCPVLVTSLHPGDTTVEERAQEWRTMLEVSGNKWYLQGKIKIETLPYNAYMKNGSLYGFSWPEYLLQCSVVQHQMINEFQADNAGAVDPLIVTNYRTNQLN